MSPPSCGHWEDNIKVEVDGELPQRRFSGKIYRNVNAAQVIEIIDYSAINYKVEDAGDGKTKKLIITP
jgi:transmembrane sensor